MKELIVTDTFVQKKQLDTYFGLLDMLAPAILVLFSFEWYSRLKPCVSKLLPIELTDFNSLSKNN
jgi:hypothetical protein